MKTYPMLFGKDDLTGNQMLRIWLALIMLNLNKMAGIFSVVFNYFLI